MKIQKIIYSEDFECDGCVFEYRDRTAKPCSLCNRNYELYSDRYVSAELAKAQEDYDEGADDTDYESLYAEEADSVFDDDDDDTDKDYSPYR